MTDDLDDFFNEIEKDIVETQKEIAHFAMENLFDESPHFNSAHNAKIVETNEYKEKKKKIKDRCDKAINIIENKKKKLWEDFEYEFSNMEYSNFDGFNFSINKEEARERFYIRHISGLDLQIEILENQYKIDYYRLGVNTQKEFFGENKGSSNNLALYATSKYDANHAVFIDGVGSLAENPATFNLALSKILNQEEAETIDSVKDIGHTITITNRLEYADDVETGFIWENTNGYFPYTKTEQIIDYKYSNEVDKTE